MPRESNLDRADIAELYADAIREYEASDKGEFWTLNFRMRLGKCGLSMSEIEEIIRERRGSE